MSYLGRFWNRRLGSYWAYATSPEKAVVLEFPDRKVVVTPNSPVEFARAVTEARTR